MMEDLGGSIGPVAPTGPPVQELGENKPRGLGGGSGPSHLSENYKKKLRHPVRESKVVCATCPPPLL